MGSDLNTAEVGTGNGKNKFLNRHEVRVRVNVRCQRSILEVDRAAEESRMRSIVVENREVYT